MIYIQRSDGAYCSFEGMSLADITIMLEAQGLGLTVVSQADFEAAQPKIGI